VSERKAEHLLASADDVVREDRFDLLIHALAQLPDDTRLSLVGRGAGLSSVRTLTEAYGLVDRVSFEPDSKLDTARLVYPSVANLLHAPIRPERSQGDPVLFDPNGVYSENSSVSTFGALVERLSTKRTSSVPRVIEAHPGLRGQRVAVVTNVPMHYRIPLFSCLSERLEAESAFLHVVFVDGESDHRPWNTPGELRFEHSMLSTRRLRSMKGIGAAPKGLSRSLASVRPSIAIVGGYSPLVAAAVAAHASRNRVTLGLWSGEINSSHTARSSSRRVFRKWIARKARFGLVYGHAAGEYVNELAPEMPLIYCRNTSPVAFQVPRTPSNRTVELVAISQLIPRKGLDLLLDALAVQPNLDCHLTIVGSGPLESTLEDRSSGDRRIEFVGAVDSNQVGGFFRKSDVLLFPSHEDIFGLSLVEAMGSGLAVVTSKHPGAVDDLVIHGVNGVVVREQTVEAWADAISGIVRSVELRQRFGAAAASTIRDRWTLSHSVNAWIAGLNLAAVSLS
jgi:glycosyltransferase involved in cell wall biosynthesis